MVFFSCASSDVFNNGSAKLQKPVHRIDINFDYGVPIVKVKIKDKFYNFLLDTGAPTIVSHEIYREFGLKHKSNLIIDDSQNSSEKHFLTIVPKMFVDDIEFDNIDAVVMDFEAGEFQCMKLDGILGANQMALFAWKFDLSNRWVEVSDDVKNWDLSSFSHSISFTTIPQQTPIVKAKVFDKNYKFTFDTGFNGKFILEEHPDDIEEESLSLVETIGAASVGMTGQVQVSKEYFFQTHELNLGNLKVNKPVFYTGQTSLIGNDFLRNFNFIIDWEDKEIYFKPKSNPDFLLQSHGFSFRTVDSKTLVSLIFNHDEQKMKLGDELISINDLNLSNLTFEQNCELFRKQISSKPDKVKVKFKRDNQLMELELEKSDFFE